MSLKAFAKKIISRTGYQISKIDNSSDLNLYQKLYSSDSVTNKRFYNIGAGSFYHPCWTNIDYVSDWYAKDQKNVLHYDLMSLSPLPIETNTAELLYTSHTIEHVNEEAVLNLFKEAHRCLKAGGGFRVTTGPDADLDFSGLSRGDEDWFYWNEYYSKKGCYESIFHKPANSVPLEERWLHHVASQLAPNDISPSSVKLDATAIKSVLEEKGLYAALDYFTGLAKFNPDRPGNHISWWNKAKVCDFLNKAGFQNVKISGYSQSDFAVLRNTKYFDNTHPQISLYVEAIK